MKTKEITIEGQAYEITEYDTDKEVEIRNASFEVELPKTKSDTMKPKLLFGTYTLMTVWAGLLKWPVVDEKGEMRPITLPNIRKYLPKGHIDELNKEIDLLNKTSEEERKN